MRLRLFLAFAFIALVSAVGVVALARSGVAVELRAYMFPGGMASPEQVAADLAVYYRQHNSLLGAEQLLPPPGRQGRGSMGMMGGPRGMADQRVRLADEAGRVLADSRGGGGAAQLSGAERAAAVPINVDGRTVGYLLAEGGFGFSADDERQLLGRLTQAALTAGLIAGGLGLLLALLLTYNLTRPVRLLTLAARGMARGDLSQRVEARGGDEIADLGRAFNHMAVSLQQAEASRKAMTADVAHELRTPLAVQRASLEAMQDGVLPLTADSLVPLLEQNHLLTRLVDDLRTLALADAGQLSLEKTPADLPLLVEQVLERFRAQASGRGVTLSAQAAGQPALGRVPLDAMRIEQILNNLISNALRFTPDGGVVEVGLAVTGATAALSVHDSGPGIPVEALERVFERFYRVDQSRSRAEGGSGLGLAIARQLARAHGGELTAANHPAGGAVFTLSLPLEGEHARG